MTTPSKQLARERATSMTQSTFNPTWSVHPGEILADELQERGWSQAYLCHLTGFSTKHVNRIIKEHAGIGVEFALALEEAFGVTAQFWMNLQTMYDIAQAREKMT